MLSFHCPSRLFALGLPPALWVVAKTVVMSVMLMFGCLAYLAATEYNYTNANSTNMWGDPLNWEEGAVPPDDGSADVIVANNSEMTIYLGANRDINSLTFVGESKTTIREHVLTVRSGEVTADHVSSTNAVTVIEFVSLLSGTAGLQLTGRMPMGAFNSGNGTLFWMSQSHIYSGTTVLNNCGAQIRGAANPDKFPVESPLVMNGAVIDVMGKAQTYAGLSGSGKLTSTATNSTSDFTQANIVPLNLVAEGEHVFDGTIGNDLVGNGYGMRLIKSGSGTQVLYGDGPYFGGTLISAGTLEVNAALRTVFPEGGNYDHYLNMSLDIEVESGATLAGHGSVGHIIADANSFIDLGAASVPGSLNALSATVDSVTVRARVGAGVTHDALVLSGNLDIVGSSHLEIDLDGLAYRGVFPVIVVDEAATFNGAFDSITLNNIPSDFEASYVVHDHGVNVVVVGGGRVVTLLAAGQQAVVEHQESGLRVESDGVTPASFDGLSKEGVSTFAFVEAEAIPDADN